MSQCEVSKDYVARSKVRSHFKVKCDKTACPVHNSFISRESLIWLDTNVYHHVMVCSEKKLFGYAQGQVHSSRSNVIKQLEKSVHHYETMYSAQEPNDFKGRGQTSREIMRSLPKASLLDHNFVVFYFD